MVEVLDTGREEEEVVEQTLEEHIPGEHIP